MEFRPTTPEDLQTILGWVENDRDMVLWSGPTFTWPLTLDQLLIDEDAGLMRIGFIIVDPGLRGQGAGRSLVDGVIHRGFETSTIPVMTLGVLARNRPAIQLYESLGFRSTGSISGFLTWMRNGTSSR